MRREQAGLAARDKVKGIERRATSNEWLKLCTVDRVRRKHDRAESGEHALRSLVNSSIFAREQMLQENRALDRMLHNPPPGFARHFLPQGCE